MFGKKRPTHVSPCCNPPSGLEAPKTVVSTESTCAAPESQAEPSRCPVSETFGLKVDLITVKALLKANAFRRLDGQAYRFCPSPDCDVVYFDNRAGSVFRREDVLVRVGQKESADPIPVCYCFDFTLADIRRDLANCGKTDIPAFITAEVKAGHCACEVKNPKGGCCLGDIAKVIKQVESQLSIVPLPTTERRR